MKSQHEIIIYIQLLNEGTDCYRPVRAVKLGNIENAYKILEDNIYDREDEEWEFEPGTNVYVEEKTLFGDPSKPEKRLVAKRVKKNLL